MRTISWTKSQWEKLKMLSPQSTRRNCRQLRDNILQSLLNTKCHWTWLLMKHELNLTILTERSLQHSQDSRTLSHLSSSFKHCFKHCQQSMLSFITSLMLKTHLTLRWVCRNFRRRRHNWRCLTMLYELNSKDRTKVIKNVKSHSMITEDTWAQTVITHHYAEL